MLGFTMKQSKSSLIGSLYSIAATNSLIFFILVLQNDIFPLILSLGEKSRFKEEILMKSIH